MASSINASTTAGVVTTADTSGVLNIQTAGTTAIAIDASQAPETFIPYDQLTQAIVIGWIPENAMASAQACVQGQINSLITPPVSPANTALPWSA